MTPFVVAQQTFREGAVELLPTGGVVLVFFREPAASPATPGRRVAGEHAAKEARPLTAPPSARRAPLFVTPHRDVRTLHDVAECVSLTPSIVKCLLGAPRHQLERMVPTDAHPMLSPFAACHGVSDAAPLWHDLRGSLAITPDERDFLELWAAHRADPASLPTSDRWVQRLCMRYAGQTPLRLKTLARLSATLVADHESHLHNSLGAFADGPHFARVCRAYTGHPPLRWRGLSQPFH